jgi:probable rRNA maturation factor
MAKVLFNSEKISFKLPNQKKTAKWLTKVCALEGRPLDSVRYIFCPDNFLSDLNKEFLGHSTYTDILSFDYSTGKSIEGEIYISIPRVRENAKSFGQTFQDELRRVMVHGLLHFFGYLDKTPSQKAQMRKKEEACLSLWE